MAESISDRTSPPAFFMIFASPFLRPRALGSNSVRRVSMQVRTASFFAGNLSVTNGSYNLFSTKALLYCRIESMFVIIQIYTLSLQKRKISR